MDTDRTPYVMFGHSRVLGDLVQLIHLLGGVLTRLVQNVPDEARPGSPTIRERLERFHDPQWNPHGVNSGRTVEVITPAQFTPHADERYIVGFTGLKMKPFIDEVISEHGIRFAPIVHPAALVTLTAKLGDGSIVLAGTVLESGVRVGRHCYINKQITVGHDAAIGDYCMLAPGVRIAGSARVDDGAMLGMGALVLEDRRIGANAIVAAGAVVTRDVPAGSMVAGVPAIVKK